MATGADGTAPSAARVSVRDHRIDLVRGFALCCIFINHMPGNWIGNFTTRNFGFSDAAEMFVLLAGVAAAFAFFDGRAGRVRPGAVGKAARRAGTLYGVHVASTLLAGLMLWAFLGGQVAGNDLDLLGLGPYLGAPVRGTISLLSGQLQFNYFNILPLYVILLVLLPGMLLLAERGLWLLGTVSLGTYAAATTGYLVMPDTSDFEGWFFNPFAWQALFTLGVVLGIMASRGQFVPYHPVVFAIAAAYLVFAAIWRVSTVNAPLGAGFIPDWLGTLQKHQLPLTRFLHIAALAYVAGHSTLWVKLTQMPKSFILTRMGRNSLPVFALGSQLSLAGWMLATWSGGGFAVELSIAAAGIIAMWALALWLEGDLKVPAVASGLERLRVQMGRAGVRFASR